RPMPDQFAEAPAGIFMLAGYPPNPWRGSLKLPVAFPVIGMQSFFDPVEPIGFDGARKFDGIGDIERHVAVDHQRIAVAYCVSMRGDGRDVRLKSATAVRRAIREGDFGAEEPARLMVQRIGACAVDWYSLFRRPARQSIDWLTMQFSE